MTWSAASPTSCPLANRYAMPADSMAIASGTRNTLPTTNTRQQDSESKTHSSTFSRQWRPSKPSSDAPKRRITAMKNTR